MNILITGGAGFIGFHLATELAENQGNQIFLLDNFSRGVVDPELEKLTSKSNVQVVEADLLDSNWSSKLNETSFEYIYHFAAIIGVRHVLERPFDVLNDNNILLSNVIQFAKKSKNLKRFVFTSTSEIYAGTLKANQLEIPTSEDSLLVLPPIKEARTSYMLSKIYGEALCAHSGLPYTIVRPHNFYGPRMGMSHVVPEVLKRVYESKQGQEIQVFSPDHTRTFCFISDAVRQIVALSQSEKGLNEAFNVGAEEPEVTIRELFQVIRQTVGADCAMVDAETAPGSPARRCPSLRKTATVMEKPALVSLQSGVGKTFDWYRQNLFDKKDGITAI